MVLILKGVLVGAFILLADGNPHDNKRKQMAVNAGGAFHKASSSDNGLLRRMSMSENHGVDGRPKQQQDVHVHAFKSQALLQKDDQDDVADAPPSVEGDNSTDAGDMEQSKKETDTVENEVEKDSIASKADTESSEGLSDQEGSKETAKKTPEYPDEPKVQENPSTADEGKEDAKEEADSNTGNVKPGEYDPASDYNHDMQPDDAVQGDSGTSLTRNQGKSVMSLTEKQGNQQSVKQPEDPQDHSKDEAPGGDLQSSDQEAEVDNQKVDGDPMPKEDADEQSSENKESPPIESSGDETAGKEPSSREEPVPEHANPNESGDEQATEKEPLEEGEEGVDSGTSLSKRP
eukprot:gnl/MRDRNA2_/MRDRNA2_121911_c0_seq1.p1 gnl/MRDRNA2_/MRDRNA2_121911_c0~~gnl/MRDRNA2_/MRDRNA2_121911_c0_seq1.p1  ORF type:complete len:347 (-),score=101.19 gnl/MRDRNA2_/MRDRNA2_121911_c0_seq1:11-1051(-)